ncbi:MAG: ATP-grasp domain-containing protein [Marinobacter sp.]|uniref:ATP-grasp domain-containing protein n=1 Tax=Marinobacter sp. TaxID=50741 RepID=UPI00299F1D04|nr:ATP-grasp domain-containing protein [Marinobacter sp.]MDX1756004.1 ATP-grasp domain-containing protein [Marinobacter sp.]
MVWNVFVLGLDELGRRLLADLRYVEDYRFHGLLTLDQAVHADEYDFDWLLSHATRGLKAHAGSVDAVVSYWDFPSSVLAPLICRRLGLSGPSLESVLKCEHKYWSRREQRAVVPDCVPAFQAVDPFSKAPLAERQLPYPFWLKPVKAHSSQLGFRIDNDEDYLAALAALKQGVGRLTRPFSKALDHAEVPEAITATLHQTCLAEGIISAGRQCTLEGFVFQGEVRLTGIVDTIRDARFRSVLCRYVYPSGLPTGVQNCMFDITRRVMARIGYDNAAFNIEFFYDEQNDRIWLLEINARLSRSHAALFQLVDGAPHFQVMVDLGVGTEPRMPHREGPYPIAAKQMIRVFEDGVVVKVPDSATIKALEREFPGTVIELNVETGTRLSDLLHQDELSYELGVIFTGAQDEDQLSERIKYLESALGIQVQAGTA